MKRLYLLTAVIWLTTNALGLEYHYDVAAPWIGPGGEVNSTGMFAAGEPGAPAVPVYPVRVLLPEGTAAHRVTITYGERVELGSYLLPPVQRSWPISQSDRAVITERDPRFWSRSIEIPAAEPAHVSTQYLAGFTVLLAEVHPIRYNPVTRQLSYYPDFTLQVETGPGDCRYAPAPDAAARVAGLVDNPETLAAYSSRDTRTEPYDYLIVTAAELETEFQVLADWRNGLGMRTQIRLIETILPEWDGVDDAEKLRNFLTAEYQEAGFRFLLLGGDIEHIPYRELFCDTGYQSDDLTSDLYFAGLDGTWNNDGDLRWGEQGEEDWLQELAVGRASVSTTAEAANFINKQIGYQQAPVIADLTDYLMVGEQLDANPTWGGTCKDQILFGSNAHGIETAGLPFDLNTGTLYDRTYFWPVSQLFNQLGNGINVTNHLGHCLHDYLMKFHNADVTTDNLTADGVAHTFHIGYSQGCIPGAFEYDDCIVELVTNLPTGYAAFIANSRYGWYQPSGTGGSSQLFDREFFDAMFGEDIGCIGIALRDSKEDLVAQSINNGYMRWVYYELNLFGDPALHIWSRQPQELAAVYEDVITLGTTELPVQVTADAQPVAGLLAAVVQDGVYCGAAYTDAEGAALITFDPPLLIHGDYELVISGWNCLPTSFPLTVAPPDGPFLALTGFEIADPTGNGNQLPEAGEELELTITLTNVGSETATNVNALLSCESEYIEVSLAAVTLADLEPGVEAAADLPFELSIAINAPDLTETECGLTMWCDDGAWTTTIPLTLHAAVPEITALVVADGEDGVLAPGETAWIEISLANFGSGEADDLAALLVTEDPGITIDVAADSLQSLPPGSEEILSFLVTADAGIEPGTGALLTLQLTAFPGLAAELPFGLVVGERREGFESGDFSAYGWTSSGDAYWSVVEENPAEGDYCARSGAIANNQSTHLVLEQFVPVPGVISFQFRVSSQQEADYLRFRLNGELLGEWSGETDWTTAVFDIPAGWHVFTWSFEKNHSSWGGEDCAWLDVIIFPPCGQALPPTVQFDPTAIELAVDNGETADAQLVIGNGGDEPLEFTLHFGEQTRDFSDDMENGENGWTHTGSWDPWHLSVHRSHSPDHAWYVGLEDEWHYDDDRYCRLITPSFLTPNDAELKFWHWCAMEAVGYDAYDAGRVEISVNGGDWQLIEPVGGYTYCVAEDGDIPFLPGTPCFSGFFDWEEAVFDLASWAGNNLRVSFLFASDAELNFEGWYIDDLSVTSSAPDWISYQPGSGRLLHDENATIFLQLDGTAYYDTLLTGSLVIHSNDPDNPEACVPISFEVGLETVETQLPTAFRLDQNYPNPFNPATRIRFCLPRSDQVRLEVFDLQGRLMRCLVNEMLPAGEQEVVFDAAGLSAGVYFYRLETSEETATRKMLLVK